MKTIKIIWLFWALLFASTRLFAQEASITIKDDQAALPLQIAFTKTTNLIFPYAIKSVDKGSREVLVQKAPGVENVMQVKAGKENFQQTNLTVITADGQLYSFILNYVAQPSILTIRLEKNGSEKPLVQFSQENDNEAVMKESAFKISSKDPVMGHLRSKKFDVGLRLNGIYIKDDKFYFQLQLNNWSNIGYDVEQLRFFIRDLKRSRRTASQENEVIPDYVNGNSKVIYSRSGQVVVVAVPKFTIPDQKVLMIQLMEANGGRNLEIRINNRDLIMARRF
ncbi:conjugative transposon protein TraN [Pedobacter paludis]|uniref:Conjugative transposon protein TraN n=1 Tax=Pedobacter paludis TaxID=2203212 RepID=A0A317F0E0_9SPHI|nr:conjugative transposon protein TraN [Pedobacter paludis]PWS32182.1 conjugative transposon protein TraN [Pedobacter paludis]